LAGEPSNTFVTRSPRLTAATVSPTPSNSPLVASWNWSYALGSKYAEKRSSSDFTAPLRLLSSSSSRSTPR
jgi:hypothetical protein